jgi:hypothetical protein
MEVVNIFKTLVINQKTLFVWFFMNEENGLRGGENMRSYP